MPRSSPIIVILCLAFPAVSCLAQDEPPTRSLCDMPSNMPYWNTYCGGGGSRDSSRPRNGCDANCQQQRQDEQDRQEQLEKDLEDYRRKRKEERAELRRQEKILKQANNLAHEAWLESQKGKWAQAEVLYLQALALAEWHPWRLEDARASVKLGFPEAGIKECVDLIASLTAGTPPGPSEDPVRWRTVIGCQSLIDETAKAMGRTCAQPNCWTGLEACGPAYLRNCHTSCGGEYGFLCPFLYVCDSNTHFCERTEP